MKIVSWCVGDRFWHRVFATALCRSLPLSQGREDQPENEDSGEAPALSDKIAGVYKRVGKLLKTYKSGKLPAVFKIIPYLRNWEEVSRGRAVSSPVLNCSCHLVD